jgi:RIO kinase 2
MSSVDIAVGAIKSQPSTATEALLIIESEMRRFEYVPLSLVASLLKIGTTKSRRILDQLVEDSFLRAVGAPYRGYSLTYAGADLLALKTLVERNVLSAVGKPVGVGKESEVYDALLEGGEVCAVKFHRIGRISFRQTRRLRAYATGTHVGWIVQAERSALREFEALTILDGSNVSVPKPIHRVKHVVVMSALGGRPLIEYTGAITRELIEDLFSNVRDMYGAGVVHADLSEYNILVSDEGHVTLFDFPQWVPPDHKSADDYLSSDVNNLLVFFLKRNVPTPILPSALSYVRGKADKLEWS